MNATRAWQAGGCAGGVVRDLPQHGSSYVVSNVAAANYHDLASNLQCLTKRDGPQQIDAAEYARP
jgi:hypothetical protein